MTGFNLSEWALKHRSLVAYIMMVAVIAGVFSYFRLGRSEDPSFIIKTMVVQAAWPGATVEEIMEVLKICVAEGVEACNIGVPILADELNWTSAHSDDN